MATASPDFEGWLTNRLENLNIDHEVFGSYIIGIMEADDSTDDDKTEALTDILSEISAPVDEVCQEILQQWHDNRKEILEELNHAKSQNTDDKDVKIASIMEKHATMQEVTKKGLMTDEQRERKVALLAKYAEVSESDGEESEEEEEEPVRQPKGGVPKGNMDIDLLAPNTNAASVVKKQQEEREKNKQDHAKRKENDKSLREQQLQKSTDRKDKEKKRTQKQERRR